MADAHAARTAGQRLLAAFERIEDLCEREGEPVHWHKVDFVIFAWLHEVAVELETVEPDGSRNLHLGAEVVVFDPLRAVRPWSVFALDVWGLSAELRELLASGEGAPD